MVNRSVTLDEIRRMLRESFPILSEEYGVDSLGIFGSYIRRDQKTGSDLDLLITFREVPGLFKIIELENHLTNKLGVKVDLVMRDALKPEIGERILQEVEMV